MHVKRCCLLVAALAVATGCADVMAPVRQDFDATRFEQARNRLDGLVRKGGRNRHLYYLERALAQLAVEDPERASSDLRVARDRIAELSTSDYLAWFKTALLDDRTLTFVPADYEQLLVFAFLALVDLASGGGDERSYALQLGRRQNEIIEAFEDQKGNHPKRGYERIALGEYLQSVLAEEDLDFDRALLHMERVAELQPGYPYLQEDLERLKKGHHSERGNGVIHVFALVGRGPFRVEAEEPVSRDALLIAQTVWAILRRRATIPNFAPVKIPALAFYNDNPTEVHVRVDGQPAGETKVLTDIERTALREFEAMKTQIVARAVIRRLVKIGITEGVKETYRRDALFDLLVSLGGLLWAASEGADLRCWSLLPASIQVLRVEVAAGEHELELFAGRDGRPVGRPMPIRIVVKDGYNSYVLAPVPRQSGSPPPMSAEATEAPPALPAEQNPG